MVPGEHTTKLCLFLAPRLWLLKEKESCPQLHGSQQPCPVQYVKRKKYGQGKTDTLLYTFTEGGDTHLPGGKPRREHFHLPQRECICELSRRSEAWKDTVLWLSATTAIPSLWPACLWDTCIFLVTRSVATQWESIGWPAVAGAQMG